MTAFRYGPVELYLVGFDGDRPTPAVVDALVSEVQSGFIRLLDVVLVSRAASGEQTVVEITELSDAGGFGALALELEAAGIAAQEDIDDLAHLIAPGTSAALLAVELVFARRLADRWNAEGAVVLSSERIPAPIVNGAIDALVSGGE